jgi:ubiquinone/menaquinone biosynthesis C-methylase UbiE
MSVAVDPEGAETRILREMVDLRGADVVEMGCGDGRMTWRYAGRTRSVLGIDPSADAIGQARAATPQRLKSKVTFQVGDAARVQLPEEAFDIGILSWSL